MKQNDSSFRGNSLLGDITDHMKGEKTMNKSVKMGILVALIIILLMFGINSFAETISFDVDRNTYIAEIPERYLVYIYGTGDNNPLIQLSGNTSAQIDSALEMLGSSVWVVQKTQYHQFWLSVKDRSAGLGMVSDGESLPKQILKSYYDGVSLSRGPYFVETYNGQDYYVFENGKSIYQGGKNYYISTFFGHYEVTLRWESGDGTRTAEDIAELKDIIHSVHPEMGENN